MKLKELVDHIDINSRKLTEYALNVDNPKGVNKALMFERHLGYNKDNYQLLLNQIYAQVLDAEATFQFQDEHGERYQIDLEIKGIEAYQKEIVRTGWIREPNSNIARLVTLYVKKRS
ncbi:hypothetical protein cce_2258 [Crocosphaera subtropica ATCC 51142]|uniref:DUF6883 domain-containing protein n=1 Tax=Crocosphaera subtropica (strain ATCC 51142 / BH68) TaxID=43989 RepID=B1WPN8_CROS5|nr:DUF6883 domain-containing protein [Crocosphaera subtropica]ACB51608.1 hypothetical protein cce_2258 [Crocosphaera subtropica ATCC 51142]